MPISIPIKDHLLWPCPHFAAWIRLPRWVRCRRERKLRGRRKDGEMDGKQKKSQDQNLWPLQQAHKALMLIPPQRKDVLMEIRK